MIYEPDTTRYELPPVGITLLGYIVRRMHKTQWLIPVPVMAASGHSLDFVRKSLLPAALQKPWQVMKPFEVQRLES